MPTSRPQILILPGLGGDHRMCSMLLPLEAEAATPDYLPWRKNESLVEYSKRYLDHLVHEGIIDLDRLYYIVGISFGGPVGIEISTLLKGQIRSLILVGSLTSPNELAGYVRFFARYVAPVLPNFIYRAAGHVLPFFMRRISAVPPESLALLQDMYLRVPRRFFPRACRALMQWDGGATDTMLQRIHGEADHIITNVRTSPGANRTESSGRGAKHLVSFSHTNLVRQFINGSIRDSSADAATSSALD